MFTVYGCIVYNSCPLMRTLRTVAVEVPSCEEIEQCLIEPGDIVVLVPSAGSHKKETINQVHNSFS